jgi:hypothetical protein
MTIQAGYLTFMLAAFGTNNRRLFCMAFGAIAKGEGNSTLLRPIGGSRSAKNRPASPGQKQRQQKNTKK